MEAAVFDEDLVGVHAGDNDAGEIDALTVALQRAGIGVRTLGDGIEADAVGGHELKVRPVADQRIGAAAGKFSNTVGTMTGKAMSALGPYRVPAAIAGSLAGTAAIATAGIAMEASGTGNMKLALNGAVTIGTLDGANIEILEEVGEDNMFIFGLKVAEVRTMREQKSYRPWEYYARNPHAKRVVDSFSSNLFCPHEPDLFAWIFASVLDENDEHFHLADFTPYVEAQDRAGNTFRDRGCWTRMAILNVAHMGKFSSDRAVAEYAREIWGVKGSAFLNQGETGITLERGWTT